MSASTAAYAEIQNNQGLEGRREKGNLYNGYIIRILYFSCALLDKWTSCSE